MWWEIWWVERLEMFHASQYQDSEVGMVLVRRN